MPMTKIFIDNTSVRYWIEKTKHRLKFYRKQKNTYDSSSPEKIPTVPEVQKITRAKPHGIANLR